MPRQQPGRLVVTLSVDATSRSENAVAMGTVSRTADESSDAAG
jgi:hypothetical protein